MTPRERRLVMATFGSIEGLMGLVCAAEWLITGKNSPSLTAAFALIVLASAPFAVPLIWERLNDHKPSAKTGEQSSDLPKS